MAYEWIIDALDETWTSIDKLLRPLPPSSYDAATPCPGWSVKDVLSHLVGFEMMLRGAPVPEFKGEWPDHVHNPVGEFNEAFVQARRGEPGPEVLDEFRDQSALSLAALRASQRRGVGEGRLEPRRRTALSPIPRDAGSRQLDPPPGHP